MSKSYSLKFKSEIGKWSIETCSCQAQQNLSTFSLLILLPAGFFCFFLRNKDTE